MKEDYRNMTNQELNDAIRKKTQELIDMRNELSSRMGERKPTVNYDFTKRVTD